MYELFCAPHCNSAKEIWGTLQVNHEGTAGRKKARINTLINEDEYFRMKPGKKIRTRKKSLENSRKIFSK